METQNTAKNFALQLGSLVALYVSVTSLLVLLFGVITIAFPDAAESYFVYEGAASQVRFSIAVLVVFFPTYLILTRMVNNVRRSEHGTYLTLTKWLIYLSLLIGGVVLLGDLVAVINGFLNGDLTIRFVLKALSMIVVVGAAFVYYLFDARGYWQQHEKKSVQYGIGAAIIVLIALVVGFFNIEAPTEVREARIDNQQIQDLTDMQWRIEDFYRLNGELPEDLDTVYGRSGIEAPTAPEDRAPYTYNVIDSNTFELCAEFSTSSDNTRPTLERPIPVESVAIKNPYNWDHGAGSWCFERRLTDTNDSESTP